VLSRRLTAAAAAVVVLAACAQVDGTENGVIRENVIEPGITGIDESRALACGSEASSFRTVLEIYEVREGEPAPDEAALIEGEYVRSESELWDVVDGRLVVQHPDCGEVPTTVPAAEIVTDAGSGSALAVDEVLASFTGDDVASMGGPDCARQLAVVFAGASQYTALEGVEPETLADVEAAGYFSEPVTMWQVVDDTIRPTPDSGCIDFVAAEVEETQARACRVEARTLETAREAYLAQVGDEPTRDDLIDAGFLRDQGADAVFVMDLVDGRPRPVPGGPCEGVDLSTPPPTASDCEAQRRTLEVAVEAFLAQTGALPTTEADLVTSGMLRDEIEPFDLTVDGTVVAAPGGTCE
jgi:hypothetical protein